MDCPTCHAALVIVEFEGVELDACPACRGVWFDNEELGMLFTRVGVPDHARELEARLRGLTGRRSDRRCPRCRKRLEAVTTTAGVEIDLCRKACGIWFDHGELAHVLALDLPGGAPGLEAVKRFLGDYATPARMDGKET